MPYFTSDYLSFDVHIEETKKKDRKNILMLLKFFSLTWKKIPTCLVFGRRGYPKSKLERRKPSMAGLLIPRRVRKDIRPRYPDVQGFSKLVMSVGSRDTLKTLRIQETSKTLQRSSFDAQGCSYQNRGYQPVSPSTPP